MLYFSICFQRKTVNNSNKSIYCAQYNVIVPFLFLHFFTNQTPPNQHPKFTESNNQNLKPCFYNETKTPNKNPSLRYCWAAQKAKGGKHVKMRSKYYHFWVPNRPTGSCGFWRRKRQESLCIYKERELAVKP